MLRKKDKRPHPVPGHRPSFGAAGVELNNGTITVIVDDWDLPYLPDAPAPGTAIRRSSAS
jgi:hypothetical protein